MEYSTSSVAVISVSFPKYLRKPEFAFVRAEIQIVSENYADKRYREKREKWRGWHHNLNFFKNKIKL